MGGKGQRASIVEGLQNSFTLEKLLIWNSACGPVPSPFSLRGFLISPLVEVIIQMAIREMQLSDSWWLFRLWQYERPSQPPTTLCCWTAPNRYSL